MYKNILRDEPEKLCIVLFKLFEIQMQKNYQIRKKHIIKNEHIMSKRARKIKVIIQGPSAYIYVTLFSISFL